MYHSYVLHILKARILVSLDNRGNFYPYRAVSWISVVYKFYDANVIINKVAWPSGLRRYV